MCVGAFYRSCMHLASIIFIFFAKKEDFLHVGKFFALAAAEGMGLPPRRCCETPAAGRPSVGASAGRRLEGLSLPGAAAGRGGRLFAESASTQSRGARCAADGEPLIAALCAAIVCAAAHGQRCCLRRLPYAQRATASKPPPLPRQRSNTPPCLCRMGCSFYREPC